MHVAYWKRCDNLYWDKSPLPHQLACLATGLPAQAPGLDCIADRHHIALSRRTTAMLVTDSPALPDGAVYASSLWHEASHRNRQSWFAGADPLAEASAVKTTERSLANRSLSEAAIETIDALHQHRLLTTSQIREMVLPGRSVRRTQQVLAELIHWQLADWVAARGSWPGPAERVCQDEMILSYRFLELDRATLPMEDLFAKLRRYVDLDRCWDDYWQAADSTERERMPAWPSRYLALPSLMVVFANPDRGSPRLRISNVMTLCRHAQEIMRNPGWFSFALFDELVASGPFAAVFRRLDGEGKVNWLGEPSGVEGQAA